MLARSGEIRPVTAWEVEEIAFIRGGSPPEDLDDQFTGLRYLTEPGGLIQGGFIELLIGLDHS